MRSSFPSVVGQITSSRQSPRMSADSDGVALVPLTEVQPSAVTIRSVFWVFQFHLSMWFLSSSSRKQSPSHQTAKLQLDGFTRTISLPLQSHTPSTPAPAV